MATVCGLLLIETSTLMYKECALFKVLDLHASALYANVFFHTKKLQANKTRKSNASKSS